MDDDLVNRFNSDERILSHIQNFRRALGPFKYLFAERRVRTCLHRIVEHQLLLVEELADDLAAAMAIAEKELAAGREASSVAEKLSPFGWEFMQAALRVLEEHDW